MRTPEQVKWDFVRQWLEKADRDLDAAGVLLRGDFKDYESVGFHAQQAAEKFIKAFLVRHQIEFPKTHNIAALLRLSEKVDKELPERLAEVDALTPFGVEFRYPGDTEPVSREKGESALRLAELARDTILERLKTYLDVGRP